MSIHPTATGFDRAAAAYESGRPGYPPGALDLIARRLELRAGRRVLDLAAGTGKLTRELLARGADVVAVEPVAGMRAELARSARSTRLEILDGTAEAIPLPDAAMDAATVAQAFHWFDGDAALAELERVLVPGAWLAVVFNRRDLSTSVQAAIDDLLRPYRGDTPSWARHEWDESLRETDRFSSGEVERFAWVQHLSPDGLVARVASVSFVAKLDTAAREQVLDATRDLHAQHLGPGSAADDTVPLHYVTEVRLLQRHDG